jgi:hypothetical protein
MNPPVLPGDDWLYGGPDAISTVTGGPRELVCWRQHVPSGRTEWRAVPPDWDRTRDPREAFADERDTGMPASR